MKFNIYNVKFLFCCLFIFNSCQKKEQEAVNTSSNQSETPASKAELAAIKSESSNSNNRESSETLSNSSSNNRVNEPQIKQPEISIPKDPEEQEEPQPVVTPPAVSAFVAKMKESGIVKLRAELEELEQLGQESPGLAFEALRELTGKIAAMDASNLPEDLENEFETLSGGLRDLIGHIETSPIPAEVMADGREAIGAWFIEQSQEDPDFAQDFGQIMQSWGGEMQEIRSNLENSSERLKETFEKYGIEESDLEN